MESFVYNETIFYYPALVAYSHCIIQYNNTMKSFFLFYHLAINKYLLFYQGVRQNATIHYTLQLISFSKSTRLHYIATSGKQINYVTEVLHIFKTHSFSLVNRKIR
jgi:hypothetical protein